MTVSATCASLGDVKTIHLKVLQCGHKVWLLGKMKRAMHRNDGPAVIFVNGELVWYSNNREQARVYPE